MAVSEADMRSAWLHLEESRKANPRLLQVASLPQQTVAGEQSASINLCCAQLYNVHVLGVFFHWASP